jgi:hypothetical protein
MADKNRTTRDAGLRRVSTTTKWIAGGAAVLTGVLTVWEARSVQHATASNRSVEQSPSNTGSGSSTAPDPSYSGPGYTDPGYSDGSGSLQVPDTAPAPSQQPPIASSGGS